MLTENTVQSLRVLVWLFSLLAFTFAAISIIGKLVDSRETSYFDIVTLSLVNSGKVTLYVVLAYWAFKLVGKLLNR